MTPTPQFTDQPWNEIYSDIIDVRSQAEFAQDHIPGAINLPVLNDDQRAQVGTVYKQESPFKARKLGAALVSENIAIHLQQYFADKPKDYQPLIYCWRGGQRSGSMALVLTQIGWRVTLLKGGYKTYRAWVRSQLETLPEQFEYRILAGLTGSAKTLILQNLSAQALDLEGLANHRGSLLGVLFDSPQPTQKGFESRLLAALQKLDPSQPVWLEAESNKIGQVYLPQALWKKMQVSTGVELKVGTCDRVNHLLAEYPQWIENPEQLKQKLDRLISRHGKAQVQHWATLINTQQWSAFVQSMLEDHYDPAYSRSFQQQYPQVNQTYELSDLSSVSLEKLQAHLSGEKLSIQTNSPD
ncbi:tRNA 2-selenouridine synthase [Acaryochloris thomasi RCC1774]|uniref:tRNA 2-selenouridine synthase n=1 Tax=Acaryochloris thomasi RCC1774 TaxID=1764569 RepID=A0A2W1JZG0_9CYAN|nr:tRNA 2-selenouridine(34) synthase MnmH [Acaryochloris thomasi]PZD73497.1 tRNA 2-selenouridine synthase [Acaryochloris thomasi RCC1774]